MTAIGFLLYSVAWVMQNAMAANVLNARFKPAIAFIGMMGAGLVAAGITILLWRYFP